MVTRKAPSPASESAEGTFLDKEEGTGGHVGEMLLLCDSQVLAQFLHDLLPQELAREACHLLLLLRIKI